MKAKQLFGNLGLVVLGILGMGVGFPAFAGSTSWKLPLTEGWKAKPVSEKGVLAERFYRLDFSDASWESTTIPKSRAPFRTRYIFYRLWFVVPAAWQGQPVRLHIGGADDNAVVYLNGQKLGEHKGWEEAFEFDVTQKLRYGARNLLAVLCDNAGGGYGGLWRTVYLYLPVQLQKIQEAQRAELRKKLKALVGKYRIIYETYRSNNWELFSINPDGSDPVNLTQTPNCNELYPHVSPDGTKVCFVVDEVENGRKIRNVYYMNIDGTGRVKVAENARQPCWSPDGTKIAFLKGEYEKFTYLDYASKGLYFYDLKTGKITPHPNPKLYHLYNICWSPDGRWFTSTVHGGMGFSHAILLFPAWGKDRVINLGIHGCRPDFSPDGNWIAWGRSDWDLYAAQVDWSVPTPHLIHIRPLAHSDSPMKIYHVDWSPDGRFYAFSRGPKKKALGFAPEMVGIKARGWNICVGDATKTNVWVQITFDGNCNKEPDWYILPKQH